MRKTIGALAVAATLLWVLASAGRAAETFPRQYGVELLGGGSYFLLTDVNDYLPSADPLYKLAGRTPEQKLNLGAQYGLGLLYRMMPQFGWQLGYERFVTVADSKFRITNGLAAGQSWAEQTLSGSEIYAMATWYWPWDANELSFGAGPAIYTAVLDRSVDLNQGGGSHITAGSFDHATGRSFGWIAAAGFEMSLRQNIGLSFQVGGRLGEVDRVTYRLRNPDPPPTYLKDNIVYLNSATGKTLPVDFTGAFFKVGLHSYFQPAGDWRSPSR